MKGAAAALAGALLFFLGVLTAASDGGRVPAPAAIPLGVKPVVSSAAPGSPADGERTGTPAGDPTIPAEGAPGSGSADPSSTPAAGEGSPAGGGSNGVEEVGGQVDCVEVGDQAGRADACPPRQAKKAGERPKDQKGAGDGRR